MTTLTPESLAALLLEGDLLGEEHLEELRQIQGLYREVSDLMDEIVHRGWLTRYQADQILAGRAKDLLLGAYRILTPVGEGGMGQVFRAEQRRLGRVVALKVIHHDYLANRPEAIRRFHREARAAAQLSHPNAIRIYDADQDGNRHFIVMEFVEGMDLARLVEQSGPLPIPVACDYIAQAAMGLQHAHEIGVIHRDIKPSNLLVTRVGAVGMSNSSGVLLSSRPAPGQSGRLTDGRPDAVRIAEELRQVGLVKILDLGLARAAQNAGADSALTVEGNVMGTPDYIAPEQARDPHGVDGRADIYSLGCTFYFALTGRPPFPKSSAMEKLLMHQCDEPLPVEAHRPKVPEAVGKIVRQMMAKQAASRYQSAMEVAQALQRVSAELAPFGGEPLVPNLGESGTQTTPVCDVLRQPAPPVIPTQPGNRTPAVSIALDRRTLSDLPDLPPSYSDLKEPPPKGAAPELPAQPEWRSLEGPKPAEERTKEAPPLSMELNWGDETPSTVETRRGLQSQDSVPDLPAAAETVRERSLDWSPPTEGSSAEQSLYRLEGHSGCVLTLAFSPNGRLLVSGGVDGILRLWSIDGQEFTPRGALQALGGEVHALAFSADSRLLGYGTASGHAWVCELAAEQSNPTMARELVRPNGVPWNTARRGKDGGMIRQGHIPAVHCMAFAPEGEFVAFGSGRTLHLFNITGAEPRHWVELTGHTGDLQQVLFGIDGKHLASAAKDETLRLWEPFRYFGKLQTTLKVPEIGYLSYSPNGKQLAFASGSRSIQVWGVAGKQPDRLARFDQIQGKVRYLAFEEGGHGLMAANDQGHIWVRDLNTGNMLAEQKLPFLKAYSLASSPDGRFLATGNIDGTISIHLLTTTRTAPTFSRAG